MKYRSTPCVGATLTVSPVLDFMSRGQFLQDTLKSNAVFVIQYSPKPIQPHKPVTKTCKPFNLPLNFSMYFNDVSVVLTTHPWPCVLTSLSSFNHKKTSHYGADLRCLVKTPGPAFYNIVLAVYRMEINAPFKSPQLKHASFRCQSMSDACTDTAILVKLL